MKKLLIASAAAMLLAGPAAAQPRERLIERALPSGVEIEAMAPALDRMTGALLDVEVGPLLDAVDPYARRPGYGRPGRTLGRLAERDDPYFEQRLRGSIYGTTAEIGRMMDAFAVAAPGSKSPVDWPGASAKEAPRACGISTNFPSVPSPARSGWRWPRRASPAS
jgi:hypothetical protein